MSRSSTIIEGPQFARVVHPGEILKDELEEVQVSPAELARQIDVPANRVSQIIAGKRAITGDTALRLGHWFRTAPQFWLNLQSQFDLALAMQQQGEAVGRLPRRAVGDKDEAPSPPLGRRGSG